MSKAETSMFDLDEELLRPLLSTSREAWLNMAARRLTTLIEGKTSVKVERKLHVGAGFPSKSGKTARSKVIGQCHYADGAKYMHIYIHPGVADAEAEQGVLATLAHELIHSGLPTEGHRARFANACDRIGLVGKPTATVAPPEWIEAVAKPIIDELGPYPAAPLKVRTDKQTVRMYKLFCEDCGWIARASRKSMSIGVPSCPGCSAPATVEDKYGDLQDYLPEPYPFVTYPVG